MKISLFTLSSIISPFELGGLEFCGELGSFYKDQYRSQDLQMIFISLLNFSYSIREGKNKYKISSGIVFYYKKSGGFLVNKILIERISYIELIKSIHAVINDAINCLRDNGISDKDAILIDLSNEKIDIEVHLNNK